MIKRFKGLIIFICLVSFWVGGCASKTKTRMEPMVTPEIKEEVKVEPGQIETEEKPTGISQSEVIETELEQSLVAKKYPGIEGEFFDSSILKDTYFAFDKSDLTSLSRKILTKNASLLKKFRDVKIQIEGHCDERGSTGYNLALGERRAASVKNYLISLGISSNRLSTISYGEEMPIDPRHNENAWAKNRRSHMILMEK